MFDGKLVNLRPCDIIPDEHQPRKSFDEYKLALLAESIRENGIIEPLIVRPDGRGKYRLIAGERRLRAGISVGLKRIPCIVRKTDNLTAECFMITENLGRTDLSPFEEADGINRLINIYGLSLIDLSGKLGVAPSTLEGKLQLLRLSPSLRERIVASRLTERHARALIRLPENSRADALDFILAKGLTFTETEGYIDSLLAPKPERQEPVRKCAIGDLRLFANSLTKMVDTMRSGGVDATATRQETETHIEYTVVIAK